MKTCNVHGIGMPTSLFFRTINQTWLISCFQVNRPNENLIRLDDMDLFLEDNLHSHVFRVPRQEIMIPSFWSPLISLLFAQAVQVLIERLCLEGKRIPQSLVLVPPTQPAPNRSAPDFKLGFASISSRGGSIGPMSRNSLYDLFTCTFVYFTGVPATFK